MTDLVKLIDVDFKPVRPQVRSDKAELAQSHIGQVFAAHRIEGADGLPLNFVHSRADLGALSFNRLGYGVQLDIVAPPLPDFYLFQVTLEGELLIDLGDEPVRLAPGSVFVMNPGVPYRKRWHIDSRQLLVRIPVRILELRLMADLRRTALSPVRFELVPVAPEAAASLLRLVGALCQDLSEPHGLAARPQVAETLEAAFLSALLATLPHDQSAILSRPPSPAAPYYVNRAEHFMRARAAQDVTLMEIAAAAGVTERTLQDGFRRFRGASPMTVLRNIRLDLAREEMMRGFHPKERTVTDIALDCGFAHLGRFARSYAERFGEPPSETLRRRRYAGPDLAR